MIDVNKNGGDTLLKSQRVAPSPSFYQCYCHPLLVFIKSRAVTPMGNSGVASV